MSFIHTSLGVDLHTERGERVQRLQQVVELLSEAEALFAQDVDHLFRVKTVPGEYTERGTWDYQEQRELLKRLQKNTNTVLGIYYRLQYEQDTDRPVHPTSAAVVSEPERAA